MIIQNPGTPPNFDGPVFNYLSQSLYLIEESIQDTLNLFKLLVHPIELYSIIHLLALLKLYHIYSVLFVLNLKSLVSKVCL